METSWPRIIVHADMDAFYAAVEQLDEPELRGRPILVGPQSGRGVVLTASYEARPYGVGSAMPMAEARQRCPQAIIIPPRFERYRAVSRSIMAVFRDFSPYVERLSLDEAFLDMSGSEPFFGDPRSMGRRIKQRVREVTGGLTASVGVSGTKYVAKVASAYRKPDGLTIVPQGSAREWLGNLPVSALWGAGQKTQARLRAAGFETIGDVATADSTALRRHFGRMGLQFHRLANADDPRAVLANRGAKSISSERTLETDIDARAEIEHHIRKAADDVGRRLRREGYTARGVRLKLKTHRFEIVSRQRKVAVPTQSSDELYRAAVGMLPLVAGRGPFRLVGVGTFDLERESDDDTQQLDLVPDAAQERQHRLEQALDAVEKKFGTGTVHRAGDLVRTRDIGIGSARLDDD